METIVDDAYMKKHLAEYILFQADQGYTPIDIKNALKRFGYKKHIIKDLFLHLPLKTKTKQTMYSAHDLDNELRIYVQSLLIDYIVKEHKVGYTLGAIRKALVNFGHDAEIIDEAINIITKGKVVDYHKESAPLKFAHSIVGSLTVFLIFAFLVFLSISTNTSIFTIIPNFVPLFIAFVIVNIAFMYIRNAKTIAALPLFGILIAVGSFIGAVHYGLLGNAPGSNVLLILNVIMAFISSGIVCAFSKKEKEAIVVTIKDTKEKKEHTAEEKRVEQKIHVPTLTAHAPEQDMPAMHAHAKKPAVQAVHKQQKTERRHEKENSMLHYVRHEIDKHIDKPKLSDVSLLPQRHKRKERLQIKEMKE